MNLRKLKAVIVVGGLSCGPAYDSSETLSDPEVGVAQNAATSPLEAGPPMKEDSDEIDPPKEPEIRRAPRVGREIPSAAWDDKDSAEYPRQPSTTPGITFDAVKGILTMIGTSGNDSADVGLDATGGRLIARVGRYQAALSPSDVKAVQFWGGLGDDIFTTKLCIPVTLNGGDGADTLTGGCGNDFIVGGLGQDTLSGMDGNDVVWGSGGSDTLFGGNGDDVVFGHGGGDTIYGGPGRDTLNGGSGDDELWGDGGNDLIITVGHGKDTVIGGPQTDNYWADFSDVLNGVTADEQDWGYVHRILAFSGAFGSFPSTSASGEALSDPKPVSGDPLTMANFADNPLFASTGPTKDDIFQGSVGDCYFMSRLSAVAMQDPEHIRRMVAPLGDGSYAVRLFRNGNPHYLRVDADFYVSGSTPRYAKEGQQGAIWVPVVEKAFAIARRDQSDYGSISGGNGQTLSQLGYQSSTTVEINDGLSSTTVKNWYANGSPAGSTATTLKGSVTFLLYAVNADLNAGRAITTGARSGITDATAIQLDDPSTSSNESTYRRGQHIYQVDHVNFVGGTPVSLTLRDPYGSYRTITDPTRMHFCIGRYTLLDQVNP